MTEQWQPGSHKQSVLVDVRRHRTPLGPILHQGRFNIISIRHADPTTILRPRPCSSASNIHRERLCAIKGLL
jgi:hypothetical protein